MHFTQIKAVMPMLQLLLVHAGTSTQLWIVLEYHSRGSLYSYLMHNEVTVEEMGNFMISLTSAIDYLHFTSAKKPGVIHRDIKSQNILVKQYGCCLADFDLALTANNFHNVIYVENMQGITVHLNMC